MPVTTHTRNAGLTDLVAILQDQQARKLDIVAPASQFRSTEGLLVVKGAETVLSEDGVTVTDGTYRPTTVWDSGVSERLGVPVAYLRRMRAERPDLYDANVNGWLHGRRALIKPVDGQAHTVREAVPGDQRQHLLRLFRGDTHRGIGSVLVGGTPSDGDGIGVARALLSDTYAPADNLDVLMSVLDGIRETGTQVDVAKADLTDRRMVVKLNAPAITAMAPQLLQGYRSPFTGATGADNPLVSAGLRITNSETGDGAFQIVPEVTVLICANGMTMTKDAVRQVHLGSRLEAGTIRWAEDTERKNLELVKAKARDAVATFLSPGYLTTAVARLERRAGEPVDTTEDAVRELTRPLGYTQTQVAGILDHFVRGGQFSRGGVVNAITSYSQTLDDADDAHTLDSKATSLLV